jgi:calcium/proton exchanger
MSLKFNKQVTSIMSSLMVVSSAFLVIPTALYSTSPPTRDARARDFVLDLSHVMSIILLAFYLLYLYFQLNSHAEYFKEVEEDDQPHELGPLAASIVLVLATLGVTVCSDYLVDSIDGVVEAAHVSRTFIGLIIVPIVGNAGELVTAVNAAMGDKLDLAIGLVVGSTLQIALFVTPFLVVVGWIIDQPMSLRFDLFQTTAFTMSVLVVNYLIQDAKTNYFAGALLIGV